jgi:hypothetical protein
LPDINNPNTKAILEKRGPFKYEVSPGYEADLPILCPYELENGAIYLG